MIDMDWKGKVQGYDERRDFIIPGDHEKTIQFCVHHFLFLAKESIDRQGYFAAALSGGSTPKAIYNGIFQSPFRGEIDWNRILLFWSDERCVPKNHPDSNYHMAMEAGFSKLPIPHENIFPMPSEGDLEQNAKLYESQILEKIPSGIFDLVMLGMGEDGHTASLFPKTHALHVENSLVVPNFVPEKNTWRMTLTYPCINRARHSTLYVLGTSKAAMVKHVFTSRYQPDLLPVQKVGTSSHRALWILDNEAAVGLA